MTAKKTDSAHSLVSRRKMLGALGASGMVTLAGCISSGDDDDDDADGADPDEADVSAAWIYFAEPGDLGWTFSHDQGYQATVEAFGEDELRHTTVEDVDAADVEETAVGLADDGYDVIFAGSADFTDPMAAASEQFPDVAFETASGINSGPNYGAYHTKLYQARYLVGYAAGLLTENGQVGYVAANPVSTVYQEINGFASGLQDANADATMHLQWTNDWFDPSLEGEAAQTLIDDHDIDVIGQHQDSPSALETGADAGIWASGYAAPMEEFAGEHYLMTPVFNWEEVYIQIIEEVRDGDWEAGITYPGFEAEAVDVTDPGPNVPDDVIDEVMDIRDDMIAGDGDEIVWGGTPFEDWSDEEILFNFDSLGIDNIDGQEL